MVDERLPIEKNPYIPRQRHPVVTDDQPVLRHYLLHKAPLTVDD